MMTPEEKKEFIHNKLKELDKLEGGGVDAIIIAAILDLHADVAGYLSKLKELERKIEGNEAE